YLSLFIVLFFFFTNPATTVLYTLSLHDALPIYTLFGAIETEEIQFGHFKGRRKWENLRQVPTQQMRDALINMIVYQGDTEFASRSEEHTSELQSRSDLVCRLLLEKKKKKKNKQQ